MDRKKIELGIIVVALTGAGFFIWKWYAQADESSELVKTTYWMCHNPQCGQQFQMAMSEYFKKRMPNGLVACPSCGQARTSSGVPCPKCQKHVGLVGHGDNPEFCPHCHAKIGDALVQTTEEVETPLEPKTSNARKGRGG